jgi:predicted enzyme related to lactoylglutathione lyase
MSDHKQPPGSIGWTDLTVPNAEEVRKFYQAVVGWKFQSMDMGGYSDYCMMRAEDGQVVAGICHARGDNAQLPPQWLVYLTVKNLKRSVAKATERGGKVLVGPKSMGGGGFAVIQDPAGAVAALFQPPPPEKPAASNGKNKSKARAKAKAKKTGK